MIRLLLLLALTGCAKPAEQPAISLDEDRQLNASAAWLDANAATPAPTNQGASR